MLIFLISLIALLKISVWTLPFVRDGFGYAYVGGRIAQGAILFKDVWDHKPPGVYFLDALTYLIFPDYIFGVRILSLVASVTSAIFFYCLIKSLFNSRTAFLTTVLFSIFTNVYMVTQGDNLVESYMIPFVSLSYILFIKAYQSKKILFFMLTGVVVGILFIFKQVGILAFFAFALFIFWKDKKRFRNTFYLGIGVIVPLVPFVLYFYLNNAFAEALDAIFLYNFIYSRQGYSVSSISQSIYYLIQVLFATLLMWVLGIIGLIGRKLREKDFMFLILFLFAFLGTMLGGKFAFSRNYFLLLFPALGYFAAVAIDQILSKIPKDDFLKKTAFTVFTFLLFPSIILHVQSILSGLHFAGLFDPGERQTLYALGLPNYSFISDEKIYYSIANYLRKHVQKGDSILDFGAEPEFYLLTKTYSPTRFFYNFPLNGVFISDERQEKRREIMMSDILIKKPLYIVTNREEERYKPSFKNLKFPEFKEFVEKYYFLEKEIGNYMIFRLKNS
ncbi:MAG: glycosyltransferase family 39 protein [Candidatus Levybacteria bacterium]|nr:glycosyltransferase family 39 protein [Candidatus Levybacteria bacterium]